MSDRAGGRRGASRTDAAKAKLAALQEQRASGKRRAELFEVEQEASVFDKVDEKEYRDLVAKRRREGAGFVVGGGGYADIGEEEDWDAPAPSDGEEEGEEGAELQDALATAAAEAGGGAKGKKEAKGAGGSKKALEPPPKFRTNDLKMLLAKSAVTAQTQNPLKRKQTEDAGAAGGVNADSLLADVLAGIDADCDPAPLPARPAAPRPAALRAAAPASDLVSPAPPVAASLQRRGGLYAATGATPASLSRAFATPAARAAPVADDDGAGVSEPEPLPFSSKLDAVADRSPAPAPRPSPAAKAAVAAAEAAEEEEEEAPAPAAPAAAAPAAELMEEDGAHVAGWASVYAAAAAGDADDAAAAADEPPAAPAADGSLPLDPDGSLPFFFLDAFEDANAPGTVFMFGKVPLPPAPLPAGAPPPRVPRAPTYVSACAAVESLQRCVFAGLFDDSDGELAALEARVAAGEGEAKGALMRALQAKAAPLKVEIRELLMARGVTRFSMRPVKRSYAFEREDVPRAEQYVLKIKYAATHGALPSDLKGDYFCALFGTQASSTELLLLKRRVMGPSWLALRGAAAVAAGEQRSWCKLEVRLGGHKGVCQPPAATAERPARDAPPLVVASLLLKTVLNSRANTNEIAAASVVVARGVNVDAPMAREEWNTPAQLRHFSVVRRLDGVSFPPGWEAAVAKENAEHPAAKAAGGAIVLSSQANERGLLSFLLAKLHQIDPDVLVGHNIAGFDVDVLLHRLQANKVPHWSRVGRLKRAKFPHLGGGGGAYGGGAGAGAMTALAGRLLADTYLAAREYSREVSYTLTALAKTQLGMPRTEVPSAEVPARYASVGALMALTRCCEADAWLALGLLFHFSVLPLTRQLTCLSGSLWNKTLAGARAQRIEYLLLHEFHGRKFLLPDKLPFKERARIARAAAEDADGGGGGEDDEGEPGGGGGGGEGAAKGGGKKRGPPAYAGGLVLEPKKGLYDKFILLLDFNSLYPSIIQEYNICFTTVERPHDGGLAPLPPPALGGPGSDTAAVLPQVLRRLVQRRRQVKDLLKTERNPLKRRQLDIRQQALKLTANSMYGCLGFANSRFYAKPLAELVTSQGREILQSTVDLVQGTLNLEVIYGDTDSIMISTGSEDLAAVKKIGAAVKKEVNKRYKLLEIEMDGVFKSMLLLKKKKYAALKMEERPDGTPYTVIEAKGLDIVRRDWCGLSKELGNATLAEILSGKPADDVVAAIHDLLRGVRARLEAGAVPREQFIITKALTKRPEDYPDAASQPHVQVALRRLKAGKREGVAAGETVPYIICAEVADGKGGTDAAAAAAALEVGTAGGKGLAERAFHPEEIAAGGKLAVDISYYLAQQLHPVVARLCAPIAGTDAAQLAACLGLDPSRFAGAAAAAGAASAKEDAMLGARLDDESRYARCTPLKLRSRADGQPFVFPGVGAVIEGRAEAEALLGGAHAAAAAGAPALLTANMLANQVKLAADAAVAQYYDGWLRSDDELYPCDTRCVSLRGAPPGTAPPDAKCSGRMARVVTEGALYTQLAYFWRLLDVQRALARVPDGPKRDAARAKLAPVEAALRPACAAMEALCSRSAYRWVSLGALCATAASTS